MLIETKPVAIRNFLNGERLEEDRKLIIDGLQSSPKNIPSKFFYNDRGSELYEQITRLPEYYPPDTEKELIRRIARQMSTELAQADIVELGSGDCSKISLLLAVIAPEQYPSIQYVPFDVSELAIRKSARQLNRKFPGIAIRGLVADFQEQLHVIPNTRRRVFCFFGSTLGNLEPDQANRFLKNLRRQMHPGDRLLLGLDRIKDIVVLEKAYNDSQGVTAAFNRNILSVVNSYLATKLNSEDFDHLAFFNSNQSRIEMHLKARHAMQVSSPWLEFPLVIEAGETIHTENSRKFSETAIRQLAAESELRIRQIVSDARNWFSLVHLSL